jgi:hypothetical protein
MVCWDKLFSATKLGRLSPSAFSSFVTGSMLVRLAKAIPQPANAVFG